MTRFNSLGVFAGILAAGVAAPSLADEPKAPATPNEETKVPAAPAPMESTGTQPPAAPAGTPAAQPAPGTPEDPKDTRIRALEERLEDALRRIEELEKERTQPPVQPQPAPQPPAPGTGAPTRGASASFVPNISIIGNLIAGAGDTKATPNRGRATFKELEIAFQDAVAPNLRYDIFVNAEQEESWRVGMEEGYLTATAILKGLNARAGLIRTPFGKFNRLHPHVWPFITQPSAHTALLGDHGLVSEGGVLEYLLPVRGLYANLELGVWRTARFHAEEEHEEEEGEEHEHEHEGGFQGGEKGAYSARLALGKSFGRNTEVELGFSRYWGRGEVEDLGRRMLALNGIDFTLRRFGEGYKRWMFQAELLAHETRGVFGDTKLRPGAFATLTHRWDKYWEAGLRLDYTKFPYPIEGTTYGGSLFLTRFLTEQTSLRLEYRHARDREFGSGNSIFFQLLFGSGPHQHNLQ